MASPRQRRGAGPPDPMEVTALQPKTMLRGKREGAVATAPCPAARVTAAPGGLRCKAFLLLAIFLCATALPYSLGFLSALPQPPPGSLTTSSAWPDVAASQRGTGGDLVAAPSEAEVQQRGRALMGSAGTPGCFPGLEGDESEGTDAGERSLGTPTMVTASPSAAWTSLVPRWQPASLRAPSDAPAGVGSVGTTTGPTPQSHSTVEQPRGDEMLGASPDHWFHRADLSPPVVTARDLPSTASVFSDAQHEASVAKATTRSCNEQKERVSPSPGMGVDHTAAPHLLPLPEVPSALPSARTSNSTKMPPDTSAVTPEMLGDTWPAGTFPHGQAAQLEDTALAKAPGNGSGLLATVLASLPSAQDVSPPQVLAPVLPTVESGGPAVTSEKLSDPSSLPAQQALLTPTKGHPSPRTRAPSAAGALAGLSSAAPRVTQVPCKDGAALVASPSPRAAGVTHGSPLGSAAQRPSLQPDPTAGQCQAVEVVEMSELPAVVAVAEEAGHSEPSTASVGPTTAPGGPPKPTYTSPGSAPPPSSKNPALEHHSEAVQHTSTTSLPSPSYVLTSTGVAHAASSVFSFHTSAVPAGVTPNAQSGHSVTSQHPSTAREHLPAAAGEAFTPAELVTMSKPGLSSPAQPMHVLPVQFRLLGIAYSQALSSSSSGSYRELEEGVRLMLHQMLSTYETFLQANVLEFLNGSVVVRGEVWFQGDAPAPTNSHLIRTLVTEASRGRSIFSWQLDPQSVQSGGFSLENLDLEKLSISLTVLQLGRSRADTLEGLISKVTWSLSALYKVRNFTITQLRNLSEALEVTGDLYLDTVVHADVAEVLQALTALTTCSVDLTSLVVEEAKLHLQVYPVSFLITNRHFREDLLDPLALEHQELTRDLGDVVARALRDHRSFLQAVIRGFLPGSLFCHGDVIFQHPAPTSLEVLEALVLSVGPNEALAGSDFQVDPYSLAVGEDTLEPPPPEPGFPEYAVVIMVVCGLCIITVPIVLLVCLRTKRLGWQDMATLWDRRDPEVGTQTLEMNNRVLWASSEQGPEDTRVSWQNDSA